MYKLFLYKTDIITGNANGIWFVNKTLKEGSLRGWERYGTENYMLKYDAEKVKNDIEMRLGDTVKDSCKIYVISSPKKKIKYICLVASYEKAKSVVSAVLGVAVENELVMYDAVKGKTFHYNDMLDTHLVSMRQRIGVINKAIQKSVKPLFRIRKLGCYDGKINKFADYVVTLQKSKGVSLEKRVKDFYRLLKSLLLKNEKLITENRCFTIAGDYYKISYTIESYKKKADKIGYITNNKPCVELMHRMSCETAFEWAKDNKEKRYDNYGYCMYKSEMVEKFPNPADRFVEGINIRKQIKKDIFSYTYCAYYGGGVSFSVVLQDDIYEEEEISYIVIDEYEVSPLLIVIKEFYPYLNKRFYRNDNHLPAEMMMDIVEKMKTIRDLIVNDTFSEKLRPYIDKNCFYFLARGCDEYNRKLFNDNWMEFLHSHRYEAARIYDVFIEWAQSQLRMYYLIGDGLMFNVSGP